MAFQTPITVREAVENVSQHKYLLPAIQRELVWDTSQIERLFDSLMRDYPIGSFLFWHVERQRSSDYQFYEFIRIYHERDKRHNLKANVSGNSDITAILDGQQRLTSLYIGLKGSFAYKEPRKRWDNDAAFPERKLYLNLLQPPQDTEDLQFDFQFLTAAESQKSDENTHWFKVSKILDIGAEDEVMEYLVEHDLMTLAKPKAKFANKTLFQLHTVVNKSPVINYFLEKDESLDKVLNIFIRVNSGGTPLSYSDLLLSIATAQWKHKDARQEITDFVEEINHTGDGFNFDKDFVLKTGLVLSDIANIAFKVDNFNRANMLKIEETWDKSSEAIRQAVVLISSLGYNRTTLTSNNAIIPIAYYLLRRGCPKNYHISSTHRSDREKVHKWLTLTLLKRVFSGQSDTVLRPLRTLLAENTGDFPLAEIVRKFKGTPKSSLGFNEDEIQNLFHFQYGEGYTFSTLALLYPTLDFRNKFHVDHIHPRGFFTPTRLKKRGIPNDRHETYMDNFNYLANLQFLEGVPNQQKSDMPFKDWLDKVCPSKQEKADYRKKHYIPDVELGFDNFEEFIAQRTKLMAAQYRILLKM